MLGVDAAVMVAAEGETSTGPSTRGASRLAVMAVGVGLVVGLVLRIPFTDAYFPWEHHWDEITNVKVGERMAADLSPDPGFYDYPAFVFLTQALVLVPAQYFGDYDPDEGTIINKQSDGNGYIREPGLLQAMRWTTGLIPSLVMIAAAGWLAWLLSARWWAAGLASLLAAVSAVDLRFGIFVTPDALSGAAAALALVGAVKLLWNPTRRNAVLAGAALGLAASAKYNAAVVVVALLLAHFIAHGRLVRRQLVQMAVAAAVAFAVLNIGAVLHPVRLVQELGSEGVHYGTEQFGDEGNSPVFNATWMWRSFGLGLLLGVCALLTRSPQRRRAVMVVGAFVLTYYVFVSAFPVRFARNLLPLSAALAALAATGIVALFERLAHRYADWSARRVLLGATAVVVVLLTGMVPATGAWSAMQSIQDDPWQETREWLHDNVPAGSTLAVEAWGPYVNETRYEAVGVRTLGEQELSFYEKRGVDYFVASSDRFEPYFDHPDAKPDATAVYTSILNSDCVVFRVNGTEQSIVVTQAPPC